MTTFIYKTLFISLAFICIVFSYTTVTNAIFQSDKSLLSEVNLLRNGNLDMNDFGLISNWASFNIETFRWHLVQDVQPNSDNERTRWIEYIALSEEERGGGLKSTDYQECDFFCSVSAVQIVPAQENKTYTLSAEARLEDGGSASLYLDFLNRSRRRIQPFTTGGYSEQWSRQTVTATAPIGTEYIRVILYSGNYSLGTAYWDAIRLTTDEQDSVPTAITDLSGIEPELSSSVITYTISSPNSFIFLPLIEN